MNIDYQKYLNSITNSSYVSQLKEDGLRFGVSKLKSTFGKEMYINISTSPNYEALMNFIEKYYPKFRNHFDNERLLSFVNIVKLDNRTFMYMASGSYKPAGRRYLILDGRSDDDSRSGGSNTLYIYIFGRKALKYIKKIEDIISEIQKATQNSGIYTVNQVNGDSINISYIPTKKRLMSSMIYSNDESNIIMEFLDRFNKGKKFYEDRQLLYKTGILLYGTPGTGKSSLIKAIASETNRAILSIDVSNIKNIDLARLSEMINNETEEEFVVVFEDIDCIYVNRDEKADNTDLDIVNKLLQFLDSNSSPNNVIMIATTNYIDKLDEAFVREGRFDLKLEIKEIYEQDILRFMDIFNIDHKKLDKVKEKYIDKATKSKNTAKLEKAKEGIYNQSTLQAILLSMIDYDIKQGEITVEDE